MILVDLERVKLAIAFSHPKVKEAQPRDPVRFTVCEVFELLPGGQAQTRAEARVCCSRQDQFCKEIGRKLALERAICNHVYNIKTRQCKKCQMHFVTASSAMRLTKDERQKVWEAYQKRGKPA